MPISRYGAASFALECFCKAVAVFVHNRFTAPNRTLSSMLRSSQDIPGFLRCSPRIFKGFCDQF